MLLHLVSDEKFTDYVIKIFESVNPGKNIYLLPYYSLPLKYVKSRHDNLIITKNRSEKFGEITNNLGGFDGIIIHNLYDKYKWEIISGIDSNIHLHWMVWGTDLYFISQLSSRLILPYTRWKLSKKTAPYLYFYLQNRIQLVFPLLWNYYLKLRGKNISLYEFRNTVKYIRSFSTVIPEESKLVTRVLKINSTYIPFKYATIEDSLMGHEEGICENQHFLIGNSATITNNHFDAFQLLKKYKPKGLRVYVPLSYGDSEYAEMVKKEGEILFKDQFAPIEDFLSKGQFNQVLNDCGNIIMNQLRQQGLGTILVALWKGARLYFNHRNPLYHYFNLNDIAVFRLSDLPRLNILPSNRTLADINRPSLLKLYGEKAVLEEAKQLINFIGING